MASNFGFSTCLTLIRWTCFCGSDRKSIVVRHTNQHHYLCDHPNVLDISMSLRMYDFFGCLSVFIIFIFTKINQISQINSMQSQIITFTNSSVCEKEIERGGVTCSDTVFWSVWQSPHVFNMLQDCTITHIDSMEQKQRGRNYSVKMVTLKDSVKKTRGM